jgi:hypothetical protein
MHITEHLHAGIKELIKLNALEKDLSLDLKISPIGLMAMIM